MQKNSSKSKQNILLVGGGTGGHIFPLYPLAQRLLSEGNSVHLVVNDAELDRKVINDKFTDLKGLKVHYLRTYKIDYHLSLRNLIAPFKIVGSFLRTKNLIKKINPDTVFFKGGFVGFPVLIALKYLMRFKGSIYLHDSDISAGKLTQLIGKSADHVFTNFGANATPLFYWPTNFKIEKIKNKKPKILVFGGSQGAQSLNNLFTQNINTLAKKYHVTLVAGPKNNIEVTHSDLEVHHFMPQDDLIRRMVEADLVVCRSGASIFQVLAAKTKCIAIPLPTSARNHQYDNAKYFEGKGLCYLLKQDSQTDEKLLPIISQILGDEKLQQKLERYKGLPQTGDIINQL